MEHSIKNQETVIDAARTGWFPDWSELWRYRDLFLMLVYRDFVLYYKQTFLGPLWWVIQPLLTAGIFSFVFGMLARIPTNGVPAFLFYFSGILFWNYFAECLTAASNTFMTHGQLYGKIYFPRLIAPLAALAHTTIKFSIQLTIFILIYFFYLGTGRFSGGLSCVWLLPGLFLFAALFSLSLGFIIASVSVRYRDLGLLTGFGLQLWMYLSPVLYPASLVPSEWQALYQINPMAVLIGRYRAVFFGGIPDSTGSWQILIGISLVVLMAGQVCFARAEKTFVDKI